MLSYTANDMLAVMAKEHGISARPTTIAAEGRSRRQAPRGLRTLLAGALLSIRTLALGG